MDRPTAERAHRINDVTLQIPTTLAKFGLYVCGWLALIGLAVSDAPRDVRAGQSGVEASPVELSARARWERLSPEQQARIRSRYERLQRMSSDERVELERRSNRLRKQRERLLKSLSEEERTRLMSQPAERRKQLLNEMVEAERRDHGRRIEEKLPEHIREFLQSAPPDQRVKRLQHFKNETRERISKRAVENLAASLGYGPAEIARLERLPQAERMATVLRLRKQLTAQQMAADGLPPNFTRERWEELEALPPEDYFREVWRLRQRGELSGVPALERSARDSNEAREERERLREINKALHARPQLYVELSELSPKERRAEIDRRRRQRVTELLEAHQVLSAEQLAGLRELPNAQFFGRVRALTEGRLRQSGHPARRESDGGARRQGKGD